MRINPKLEHFPFCESLRIEDNHCNRYGVLLVVPAHLLPSVGDSLDDNRLFGHCDLENEVVLKVSKVGNGVCPDDWERAFEVFLIVSRGVDDMGLQWVERDLVAVEVTNETAN